MKEKFHDSRTSHDIDMKLGGFDWGLTGFDNIHKIAVKSYLCQNFGVRDVHVGKYQKAYIRPYTSLRSDFPNNFS